MVKLLTRIFFTVICNNVVKSKAALDESLAPARLSSVYRVRIVFLVNYHLVTKGSANYIEVDGSIKFQGQKFKSFV